MIGQCTLFVCHIVIDGVGYTCISDKDYGLAVHGNAR